MKIILIIKETQTTIQGHYHTRSVTKMITIQTDQTRNQAKMLKLSERLKDKLHLKCIWDVEMPYT